MRSALSGIRLPKTTRFLVAGAAVLVLAATTYAAIPLPALQTVDGVPTLATMIEEVSPAVVNISTVGSVEVRRNNPFADDPFFRRFFELPDAPPTRRQTQSLGSGVIVDAKAGYILTNHHVIEDAEEVTVTLNDDRQFTATIVGSDPGSDVAVIRVEDGKLQDIPLADSDNARVGDFVVAIGNPFGLEHTVTAGIVSGLGRSGLNPQGYEDFIQTDASINPGNSGGALINLNGQLVGINTAIVSRSGGNIGIGFAIPINMARSVMNQILEFGEVRRGLLGVQIFPVTREIADTYGLDNTNGAIVVQVSPDSAAEKAGIKPEDVIVAVDGDSIRDATDLRNTIGLKRGGDKVRIELVRDGRKKRVTASLGELESAESPQREENRQAAVNPLLEGATFEEVNASSPNYQGANGILVSDVITGSAAAQRGLRSGDVITRVNRQDVRDLDAFYELIEDAASLVLSVIRDGSPLLIIAQ